MKYSIVKEHKTEHARAATRIAKKGGWWVRFGDDLLVYSAGSNWKNVKATLARNGVPIKARGDIRKGNMHLVVQKGRTFQIDHPDVRIILDKGRYLVVDLDQDGVKRCKEHDGVCYEITPLRENTVAFDVGRTEPSDVPATGQLAQRSIDSLSVSTFNHCLQHLTSFHTRLSSTSDYQQAANWCADRLGQLGFDVQQESVALPGGASSVNVRARQAGTEDGAGIIYLIAHLDSVNHQGGPSASAPGADDNASGASGVLTIAEVVANCRFQQEVRLLLLGGEEQGLHGSSQHVAALSSNDSSRIIGVVNMDMIGSVNTVEQTVLLEGATVSAAMLDELEQAALAHTSLQVQTSLNPFASDHVPFIDAGIPAVLTIEGADSANDSIHTGSDTPNLVDSGFALQILRMNLAWLIAKAGLIDEGVAGPSAGSPNGCGCCGGGPTLSAAEYLLLGHLQRQLMIFKKLHQSGKMTVADQQTMAQLRQLIDHYSQG